MFPTRVGMNRDRMTKRAGLRSVPHACGDEPNAILMLERDNEVFPTRVGMNR